MKKIGILLLCVVMLCSCVAPVAFAGDIDTSKKINEGKARMFNRGEWDI